MKLRTIHNADIRGRNVLLRTDFNVAIKNGDICERFKMESVKRTLDFLMRSGARTVALASHLGRPEGKPSKDLSLGQLTDDIERTLGYSVKFLPVSCGGEVTRAVSYATDGDHLWKERVFLLENVRFDAREEKNDPLFSRLLAEPFDIFVNDAFSVCHRDQSSVTGVAEFLPSFAGLHLVREVETLSQVRDYPAHPAVAIIGGAKIQTKLPLIRALEKKYDRILVGGKVANEAMDEMQKKEERGKNKEKEIQFSEKVMFPVDFVGDRLDIGPRTVEAFRREIAHARTVVWNGPMGKFEDERYARGTKEIARAVAGANAFSVVGGGESVEMLEENNLMGKISFVSTGGGAMLAFLSGGAMPGLDVLRAS